MKMERVCSLWGWEKREKEMLTGSLSRSLFQGSVVSNEYEMRVYKRDLNTFSAAATSFFASK